MTLFLSRVMTDAHAERLVLGFHLAITALVFAFLGMQLLVR
jgi:hypothetical protein